MAKIHEILEQDAVYDGKPSFAPGGMIMDVLNYYALGGTRQRAQELRDSGEAPNAKRYMVRVTIETDEYPDFID